MMKLSDETLILDLEFAPFVRIRIKNMCSWLNIRTVGQARKTSDKEFLREPNFGPKSLAELRRVTGNFGEI